MEYQKILNLLNESNYSKFVTRKWKIVNDQSNANYDVGNKTIYNTWVLKSNTCDCKDACILVRGNVTIIGHQATQVAFKYCAPFTKCITKIDGTTIDDVEDQIILKQQKVCGFILCLKQLILIQILLINHNFKCFEHKARLLIKNTEADGVNGILKNATISVPLK